MVLLYIGLLAVAMVCERDARKEQITCITLDDREMRIERHAAACDVVPLGSMVGVNVGWWWVRLRWREKGGNSSVTILRHDLDRAAWRELVRLAAGLGGSTFPGGVAAA